MGYSHDADVDDNEGWPIPFHDHYEQFMGSDHDPDSDVDANTTPVTHPGSLVSDLKFIPTLSLVPEGDPPPEGANDGTSDMVPVGPDDPPLTHLDTTTTNLRSQCPDNQGNDIASVQTPFTPRFNQDNI